MTTEEMRDGLKWKHKPFPELVRLAWPIGVSMLSYSVMTLVDTLFVGRLGATSLAGVSMGGVFAFTLLCFGFGLVRAVKVLGSQAVGAGEHRRIAAYVGAGLMLALVLGLSNVALGWLLSSKLVSVSASTGAAAEAKRYADVRVIAAPLVLMACALREARYAVGDTRAPMRAALTANLVNIGLTYLFMVELGWGIEGAAWSTVLAHGIELPWLGWVQRKLGFGLDRRGVAQIAAVWRMGVPLGLQMLLEMSAFALLTGIFASMSELALASHQIALQACHFSFMPALALGEAASVLAGQAMGAREYRLVKRVARMALWVALAYTGACGLLFALLAGPIASAFTDDAQVLVATRQLLYVAAAFQLFDGANIVARCVLRGTGDVRYPAVVNVTIAWICTPPLAIGLGFGLGLGVLGGWLGLCVEIMVGAVILWWRLERSRWLLAAGRARRKQLGPRLQPAPS